MQLITGPTAIPLWNTKTTRHLEQALAARLPPHTLMRRAGQAIAQLTQALKPHAKRIWIACGPGNNGGDGLQAAAFLSSWANAVGVELVVTWDGQQEQLPFDAQYALTSAQHAGIKLQTEVSGRFDLSIDALLGLGSRTDDSALSIRMQSWKRQMNSCADFILNVDLPSGLNADTGWVAPSWARHQLIPTATLTFLTAKPGLFTAYGRDEAGEVWLDDLGLSEHPDLISALPTEGWLGHPRLNALDQQAHHIWHHTHKGSFGDVWVLGGQQSNMNQAGMVGAAILAGRAALHAGAGRVHILTLGDSQPIFDPNQPELMFKHPDLVFNTNSLPAGIWVCGCGGGEAIRPYLLPLLNASNPIVLDADALNWIAESASLQQQLAQRHTRNRLTVITPHPLEAARLLQCTTADVMQNRVHTAIQMAKRFKAICVLKGSGSVVTSPENDLSINPTGSGRLATAGTGDVLAGCIGGHLSRYASDEHNHMALVCRSVYLHGYIGETATTQATLSAGKLACHLSQ